MVEERVVITNTSGLHARPASELIHVAKRFKSNISLVRGDRTANCKSIVHVLTNDFIAGDEIIVRAVGEDEAEALTAVTQTIRNLKEWE